VTRRASHAVLASFGIILVVSLSRFRAKRAEVSC
jgi:hypothetical protein